MWTRGGAGQFFHRRAVGSSLGRPGEDVVSGIPDGGEVRLQHLPDDAMLGHRGSRMAIRRSGTASRSASEGQGKIGGRRAEEGQCDEQVVQPLMRIHRTSGTRNRSPD